MLFGCHVTAVIQVTEINPSKERQFVKYFRNSGHEQSYRTKFQIRGEVSSKGDDTQIIVINILVQIDAIWMSPAPIIW